MMPAAMYFILEYDIVDDYLERRLPFRARHLTVANAAVERGELRLAGALSEPVDRSLLVFEGPDASVAENFARNDPYVIEGLVRSWRVRPWRVVIGADYRGAPPG